MSNLEVGVTVRIFYIPTTITTMKYFAYLLVYFHILLRYYYQILSHKLYATRNLNVEIVAYILIAHSLKIKF